MRGFSKWMFDSIDFNQAWQKYLEIASAFSAFQFRFSDFNLLSRTSLSEFNCDS